MNIEARGKHPGTSEAFQLGCRKALLTRREFHLRPHVAALQCYHTPSLRFSDKQYPDCDGTQHQASLHVQIQSFQAHSFQKATPYSSYPKLGPRNPTSYSTRTKSAQGLATSQQLNLRMKLYTLDTCIEDEYRGSGKTSRHQRGIPARMLESITGRTEISHPSPCGGTVMPLYT